MITIHRFDDSLLPLNRRQTPARQTPRGNYEWSWLSAGFVGGDFSPATLIWPKVLGPAVPPQVLLFGADVPHLQTFIAGSPTETGFSQALQAYIGPNPTGPSFNAWAATFRAWSALYASPGVIPPVPDAFLAPTSRICSTSFQIAERRELRAPWGAVDAGQGALVSCTYENGEGDTVFAQGFPLTLDAPQCGPSYPTDSSPFESTGLLLVGYSSATNHGLLNAQETPAPTATQPAYIPVLYPRGSYTPAMRAANNIVTVGAVSYRIMGLWTNF
jgi:hypothetical protein